MSGAGHQGYARWMRRTCATPPHEAHNIQWGVRWSQNYMRQRGEENINEHSKAKQRHSVEALDG